MISFSNRRIVQNTQLRPPIISQVLFDGADEKAGKSIRRVKLLKKYIINRWCLWEVHALLGIDDNYNDDFCLLK